MYFKNLDPLRGFLALAVVVFHLNSLSINASLPSLPLLPILDKGTEAVLVFFTLSGYLIIGQLWNEKKHTGTISIGDFYLRRMLRLYPVYYAVLTSGIFMYFFLFPKMGLAPLPESSVLETIGYNLLFLPNVYRFHFDPGSVLEILWSIGIEEQFYLVIAPVVALLPLKRMGKVLLTFTVGYFILFHLPPMDVLRNYIMVFFFMSAGGYMAVFERIGLHVYPRTTWMKRGVYLTFILIFFTDVFSFEQDVFKHGVYVLVFSLFIPSLAHDENFIGLRPWTVSLGKVSYGIYMFHMIVVNGVLFLGMKLMEAGYSELAVLSFNWIVTIGSTIILAQLSYTYFEMPFLKLKNRFRGTSPVSKLHKAP